MFSWLSSLLECNFEFTSDAKRANCITHGGRFHADETFCNVFFGKYLPKAIIYRSQQIFPMEGEYNPDAFIYDFGYGELDHHQRFGNGSHPAPEEDTKLHRIPYASFGLVWKKYGKDFCKKIAQAYANSTHSCKNSIHIHSSSTHTHDNSMHTCDDSTYTCDGSTHTHNDSIHTCNNSTLADYLWNYVEKNLVLAIDAADNGVFSRTAPNYYRYRILTISTIITLFNMTTFETNTGYDTPLYEAQKLASLIFDTILKKGILEFENQFKSTSAEDSTTNSVTSSTADFATSSTSDFATSSTSDFATSSTADFATSSTSDFATNPVTDSARSSTSLRFYAHGIFTDVILRKIFPNRTFKDLNLLLTQKDTEILYHPNPFATMDYEPIPTSIFGIFWEKYGKDYCKTLQYSEDNANYIWSHVQKELVLGIDAYANGLRPLIPFGYVDYPVYTISDFLKDLNPTSYSEENDKESYATAFKVADSIFERILLKTLDQIQSREYIEEKIASSSGHLLILEKFAHWKEWLYRSSLPQARDIWFIIFPNNGVYNIVAVPSKYTANGYRKGFPTKWHGWNRYQGKNIRPPVPTAISIHPQGIIASTETLEDAIALAKKCFSNGESTKVKLKDLNF